MNKPIKLILGKTAPACQLVAEELVRRGAYNPEAPCVVVVPTKESARMLKEQIALVCAGGTGRGAYISPRIIPLSRLIGHAPGACVASEAVSAYIWRRVLKQGGNLTARLFPRTENWSDESWLQAADNIMQLFHTLVQEGVQIGGEAWRQLAAQDARWRDLPVLRQQYLDALHSRGLCDADEGHVLDLPRNARVILACVPHVSGESARLLTTCGHEVELWIACDEDEAWHFDPWGRPTRHWLDICGQDLLGFSRGDWKERLIVAADSWAMVKEGVHAAARANAAGKGALHAVALGVCDPAVEPALAEEFARYGTSVYRPQGLPFAAGTWQRVLDALYEVAVNLRARNVASTSTDDYPVAPLGELLRQPIMQQGLGLEDVYDALTQFKQIRAQYLPDRSGFLKLKAVETASASLTSALEKLLGHLSTALESGSSLLHMLKALAEVQPVEGVGDAKLLASAAQLCPAVRDACEALLSMDEPKLSAVDALLLLQKQLGSLTVQEKRDDQSLAINGWMELLYSPAQRLVVLGMHDKQVPERWPVSPLLTRSAREALGIRSDEDRAARDAFILRSLLWSRPAGSVSFVFSLVDTRKDPVAPSPLLFTLCPKNRLPELVTHFFDKDLPRPASPGVAYDLTGWHYLPLGELTEPLPAEQAARLTLKDLKLDNPMQGRAFSPSVLADFLACPLRFWLKRIRRIKDDDVDDERGTLQSRDVGDCLHHVLEQFVRRHPTWAEYQAAHPGVDLEDAAPLVAADLQALFENNYREEYGEASLLPQQCQRDNMAARLKAYAAIHTALWKEGWGTARDEQGRVMVEYKPEWRWNGHPMNITIDRVDKRTTSDGVREIRIIDYKTGRVESCTKKHLKALGKTALPQSLLSPQCSIPQATLRSKLAPQRWVELQLPIYAHWAMQHFTDAVGFGVAYVVLDRKPQETRLVPWGGSGTREASDAKCYSGLWQASGSAERGLFEQDLESGHNRLIDDAYNCAMACMEMISEGRCLVSSEQMGWGPPPYDLFEDNVQHAALEDLFLPSTGHKL